MQKYPLVSIIIPVYNAEKYIGRCLNSILSQNFSDWEVVLIDDGSTDRSGITCDEYVNQDSRIRAFHQKNAGVSAARNLGIEKAIGDYICFVDADDWVDSDFLEKMNFFDKGYDIIMCEIAHVKNTGISYSDNSLILNDKLGYLKHHILWGFTSVCNMIYRLDFIKKIALKFEPVRYSEDFMFSMKAFCLAEQIKYVACPLYYYDRTNIASAMHKLPDDVYKDLFYCDSNMISFFMKHGLWKSFKKEMYWKILRVKKELVLSTSTHSIYKKMFPEADKYILSCPFLNKKSKLMMWLLSHHCDGFVVLLVNLRLILGR